MFDESTDRLGRSPLVLFVANATKTLYATTLFPTGVLTAETLTKQIRDWWRSTECPAESIRLLVTDNAAVMGLTVRNLTETLFVRACAVGCWAHIFNLAGECFLPVSRVWGGAACGHRTGTDGEVHWTFLSTPPLVRHRALGKAGLIRFSEELGVGKGPQILFARFACEFL